MRMVDLQCTKCGSQDERLKRNSEPFNDRCRVCGYQMSEVVKPAMSMRPLEPYFDEGLGEMVTGRLHRRRLMRDLGMDFRDHMSKGDQSARIDRAHQLRKERDFQGR